MAIVSIPHMNGFTFDTERKVAINPEGRVVDASPELIATIESLIAKNTTSDEEIYGNGGYAKKPGSVKNAGRALTKAGGVNPEIEGYYRPANLAETAMILPSIVGGTGILGAAARTVAPVGRALSSMMPAAAGRAASAVSAPIRSGAQAIWDNYPALRPYLANMYGAAKFAIGDPRVSGPVARKISPAIKAPVVGGAKAPRAWTPPQKASIVALNRVAGANALDADPNSARAKATFDAAADPYADELRNLEGSYYGNPDYRQGAYGDELRVGDDLGVSYRTPTASAPLTNTEDFENQSFKKEIAANIAAKRAILDNAAKTYQSNSRPLLMAPEKGSNVQRLNWGPEYSGDTPGGDAADFFRADQLRRQMEEMGRPFLGWSGE